MDEDKIHWISQPLLTEEGFVNPACMNELMQAIKNTPKTHERLSDDSEWNTKKITHIREITAGLSYWAIRQIGGGREETGPAFPPNLEKVIGFLHAAIRKKFDENGYALLSLCDISKILYDTLYEQGISVFDTWNTKECLGESWLDLDALLHGVCLNIRNDRRRNEEFDRKFKEEQEKYAQQ